MSMFVLYLSGVLLSGLFFLVLLALVIRLLAKFDVLFTFVQEGRARVIVVNGRFHKAVLSVKGYNFKEVVDSNYYKEFQKVEKEKKENLEERKARAKETGAKWDDAKEQKKFEKELEEVKFSGWDLVEDPDWKLRSRWPLPFVGGWLEGIYYVGPPPWFWVREYRFAWTSLEQVKTGEKGSEKTESKFVTTVEPFQKDILIQDDVYAFELTEAETADLVPVKVWVLITVGVVNPRRALYAVNKWLEATVNRLSGRLRELVGQYGFSEIITLVGSKTESKPESKRKKKKESLAKKLTTDIQEDIDWLKQNYGIEVKKIQFFSVDPVSNEVKKGAEQVFISRQAGLAEENKAEGDRKASETRGIGEAARFDFLLNALLKEGVSPDEAVRTIGIFLKTENLAKLKQLTTYVEGGGQASVMVPVGQQPTMPSAVTPP